MNVGRPLRLLVVGLVAAAPMIAACTTSGAVAGRHVGATGDLVWARICIPGRFGPSTRMFDGLTVAAARSRARQQAEVVDFLAADGSCDIGNIPITAGHVYVRAAIAHGRVLFARISKPHYSQGPIQRRQSAPTASIPPTDSTSSTTSGTTATAPCVAHAVTVTLARQVSEDMAGTGQTLRFRNTSTTTCSLHGYPSIRALSNQRQAVTERYLRRTTTPNWTHPVEHVRLQPGASASVNVYVGNSTAAHCMSSFYWQIGIDNTEPATATDIASANVVGICAQTPSTIVVSPYFK